MLPEPPLLLLAPNMNGDLRGGSDDVAATAAAAVGGALPVPSSNPRLFLLSPSAATVLLPASKENGDVEAGLLKSAVVAAAAAVVDSDGTLGNTNGAAPKDDNFGKLLAPVVVAEAVLSSTDGSGLTAAEAPKLKLDENGAAVVALLASKGLEKSIDAGALAEDKLVLTSASDGLFASTAAPAVEVTGAAIGGADGNVKGFGCSEAEAAAGLRVAVADCS